MNTKIRHSNHITDSEALRFIQNKLPIEWIQRNLTPDYGLDIDLELFDYENNICVTLGEHIFLQIKGTHSPQYSRINVFGDLNKTKQIDVIKYQIETSILNLVERMGSAIPVLFIIVDLQKEIAYQICLNDYIRYILPYQNPNYRNQETITLYIPIDNILDKYCCEWYGKRSKLYSLFLELLVSLDDLEYCDNYQYISTVEKIIERLWEHDAWKVRKNWYLLYNLYNNIITMKDNKMLDSYGKNYARHFCPNEDNWSKEYVYVGFNETKMTVLDTAKFQSCTQLVDKIKMTTSLFENNIRHMYMPSQFNYCIMKIE